VNTCEHAERTPIVFLITHTTGLGLELQLELVFGSDAPAYFSNRL